MPPRQSKFSVSKGSKDANLKDKVVPVINYKPNVKFTVPMPPPPPLFTAKSVDQKGKGKVTEDTLWVDTFIPETEEELAVHKKKVDVVRRWLKDALESVTLRKYRKVLILAGPAGAGKTATLRMLSTEMQFDIVEWRNSQDDVYDDETYEPLAGKFSAFLNRASDFSPLSANASGSSKTNGRQVVLLEDLPNLLHEQTFRSFQASISRHIESSDTPIVIIMSEAGIRGQQRDEEGWQSRQSAIVDSRHILSPDLLQSAYVVRVDFNPIAATSMRSALRWVVDKQFLNNPKEKPSKELIEKVVESSGGDIRSALMALQFASLTPTQGQNRKTKKDAMALQVVTKREQSLALFHLLGKVLYNKRVGDPISTSLSRKEQEYERALEKSTPVPPDLPRHLAQYWRRTSKVDTNSIYADSPVDTSLFSLYIHQNYYQFCEEVEQCDGLIDTLSLIDTINEAWESRAHVAEEKFQILSLGSLISLPSPVPRLNQKMYKPEYFQHSEKTQQATEAAQEIKEWITLKSEFAWTLDAVKLHLPSVLRHAVQIENLSDAPPNHPSFSSLPWNYASFSAATALEDDDVLESPPQAEDLPRTKKTTARSNSPVQPPQNNFWIEEDDIVDF